MNHRTSRGGGYGRETGIIDLGHEPPLSVDGSEAAVIDRRRVSVQWFSGTILTGLCGAALIGGAVFASLDGEMTFAKVAERVAGQLRGPFGANDRNASLHKSDRLPPAGDSTAPRNVVRVSPVPRARPRHVMRLRACVRPPAHPLTGLWSPDMASAACLRCPWLDHSVHKVKDAVASARQHSALHIDPDDTMALRYLAKQLKVWRRDGPWDSPDPKIAR